MNGRTRIVCGLLVGVIICGFGVAKGAGFSWADKEGEYLDLLFGGRKVTRYMYAYDTSSEQRVFETYKPLHHVFDEDGKNLLTNGPDGEGPYSKGTKFPHHRGIFIGWNRLTWGGAVVRYMAYVKGCCAGAPEVSGEEDRRAEGEFDGADSLEEWGGKSDG